MHALEYEGPKLDVVKEWDAARSKIVDLEQSLRRAERDVERYTDQLATARQAEVEAWAQVEKLRGSVVPRKP